MHQYIFAVILASLSGYFIPVASLRCYQCVNVVTESGNLPIPSSASDPDCANNPQNGKSVECDIGDSCGSVFGKVSGKFEGIYGVSVSVQIRDCVKHSGTGCVKANQNMNGMGGVVLMILRLLTGLDVDAQFCTCNQNYCTPECGLDAVKLNGVCVKYWILGVSAGGVIVVFLLLVTCCCCCGCCACCRRQRYSGAVVSNVPYQTLVVAQQQQTVHVQDDQGLNHPIYNLPPPAYPQAYPQAYAGQNQLYR